MSSAFAVHASPTGLSRSRRIALVHDWLCGYRGGEAVLDRIARVAAGEHECAGLWTMVDDRRALSPAIDSLAKHTSFLQRVPGGPGPLRRWLLPCYPRAVAGLSRSLARAHASRPIDLVISTSSAAVKGVRPPPGVPHLCYCHSPARYLWSQQAEYGAGPAPPASEAEAKDPEPKRSRTLTDRLRGAGLRLVRDRLREWDARTAAHVTRFIANSTHTQAEIRRCYGRDADVIHPPVRTTYFTPDPRTRREPFWLLAGALEPYKRVDLAILAANRANHPLVIVGGGSVRASLERLAGPTVRFEGRVDDQRLLALYRSASLLLFPQVEDFGIVAAEAQACGLPVVARGSGGALDTVIPGQTGMLFDSPTVESLLAAVERLLAAGPADRLATACRTSAERFSEAAFDTAIGACIDRVLTAAPSPPPALAHTPAGPRSSTYSS